MVINNPFYQVKVLLRYKKRYLLLQKVHDRHLDHNGGWEVPGGKIKNKETAEQAAYREVKEETGLSCKILAELPVLKLEKEGIKTTTHVFVAVAKTEDVILSAEHSAFKWILLSQVDQLEKVIYRNLLKKYLQEAEKE